MKLNDLLNEGDCSYYACACCDYYNGCSILKGAKEQFGWRVTDRSFKCEFYTNKDKYPGTEFKIDLSKK